MAYKYLLHEETTMKYFTLLFVLLLCTSCSDDFGLSNFCEAVISEDENYIEGYLDVILEDLEPFPVPGDFLGHEENLFILIDELQRRNDCLDAFIECYGCIETFPIQSEILIDVYEDGFVTTKIIDLATPEFGPMFYAGIHN